MLIVRTINRVKMNGLQQWLAAVTLHLLLLSAGCQKHHRRSMAQGVNISVLKQNLPPSKGGWRPVVGSSGLLYGSYGTAPLHAPSYKLPAYDSYPTSARPITTRDAAKLTSIAQSYRPTTLRTTASVSPGNHPINSYYNPFALPNNGPTHFKYVQNFPIDSYFIRNTHNSFGHRPQQKYPSQQQQHNNLLQQLTSIQPIHFGQYQTPKPQDQFAKPVDSYGRPVEGSKKPQTVTEIFKPEVYKLPNSNTAQKQEVKTAQQQTFAGNNVNPLANYAFQDSALPPSILGSFGSFGVQSVKGRDPVFPSTKTAFIPPQPTKQTVFNSFSYTSNNFKSTPSQFSATTPKVQTNQNRFQFGSTVNDFRNAPTPQTKVSSPPKIDPNGNGKGIFKASPQDPFIKAYQNLDLNKITTYNPVIPTTTLANSFYFSSHHNAPSQHSQNQLNAQIQNYQNQQNQNYNYENNKIKLHDSLAANINQQTSQQYAESPRTQPQETPSISHQGHYEVTENHNDFITHSSPWASPAEPYQNSLKTNEETVPKEENVVSAFRQSTTPIPEVTEEFVIVTESEKAYENSLIYDGQVESQSRRPLEEGFEPIENNKLKDYYYKVSTSSYGDHTHARRTKKPTETSNLFQSEATTSNSVDKENNDVPVEALPTLPPNKHFKRPSTPDPLDKDRIRKRNKLRRRRPGFGNNNHNKGETTNHKFEQLSSEPTLTTTVTEEIYTIRPRVRPSKQEQSQTTPSVTTDLTTSALPTISPTIPSIVRKKIGHRRKSTTPVDRIETTTVSFRDYDSNNESPIMKISTRPQLSKLTSNMYEYKASDMPDYTHKQDEKDTPTSDVSVSLTDSLKASSDEHKEFSFHRDVKPVDIKETTTDDTKNSNEYSFEATTTPRSETTSRTPSRLRLRNKLDRPKFSMKDYRSRLSSTTSTTEQAVENTPKLRYPQRKTPYNDHSNNENDNGPDRKRFTPKDPRHKFNKTENNEQIEREIHSTRQSGRQRQTTVESEPTTLKISSRIRNGSRRHSTEETTETSSPITGYNKRPLRKKIKDSETGESVQDISVTETTVDYDQRNEITSERTRSESAIMKIADKKHHDHVEHLFEHSKRVSDLTLAASKDYNNPGMFKTVSGNSRRIPNYFTIATDDPILPIEAFFPQLNQKKES
ncbi:unnamed protein product [Parnassius apollo]|uniref:(apollo) hypothetical protein n=1 Tax=Parnassius apollo TaxID=110799 RepID=A0A8S3XNB3_PARAO|nr:unnamed protein product [Parnassius apollo]